MRGRSLTRAVPGLCAVLLATACSDSTGTVQVGSVAVSSPQAEIEVGESVQLTATVLNTSGGTISNPDLTWSSSSEEVATVTGSGLVTAVGVGTVRISAQTGGRSGAVDLEVLPPVCTGATHGTVAIGDTRSGTITEADCFIAEDIRGQGYRITLSSARTLQIDVVSGDFDAVAAVSTTGLDFIDADDDGGTGTNAQLIVSLEAGTYIVWAASLFADETGDYQMTVQEYETPDCSIVGDISVGQTVTGSLGASDCALDDGSFADPWSLELSSQQSLQIDLRSTDFDAFLTVTDANGTVAFTDDDSGGGTDSRLLVTLAAGQYLVWANSFAAGETGAYTLSVAQGSSAAGASAVAPGGALGNVLKRGRK